MSTVWRFSPGADDSLIVVIVIMSTDRALDLDYIVYYKKKIMNLNIHCDFTILLSLVTFIFTVETALKCLS